MIDIQAIAKSIRPDVYWNRVVLEKIGGHTLFVKEWEYRSDKYPDYLDKVSVLENGDIQVILLSKAGYGVCNEAKFLARMYLSNSKWVESK